MRISDVIENFIKEMLTEDNSAIIQRNDLAQKFNCVPSQINYVISTRFTPMQGYYVESQRGGGGYIKINRISITQSDYLMHIINNIGDKLSSREIDMLLNNLYESEIINKKEAKMIKSATNDKVLTLPINIKDEIRAKIFKNMLITLI